MAPKRTLVCIYLLHQFEAFCNIEVLFSRFGKHSAKLAQSGFPLATAMSPLLGSTPPERQGGIRRVLDIQECAQDKEQFIS